MKKYCLFLALLLTLLTACKKEKAAPNFELNLVTNPSDKWSAANIDISSLVFTFDAEPPAQLGGQRTKNWDGVSVLQDLTAAQSDNLSSFQHIEMTTFGIRPDWKIILYEIDATTAQTVNIPETDFLSLSEEVVIENGKAYDVVLIIDPNTAFVEENKTVRLDWAGVSVLLSEK